MAKLKLLVIDDEEFIRRSFQRKFDNNGYKVFTADSAEGGKKIFESEYPDVVFIDHKYPKMQSLDLIRIIKQTLRKVKFNQTRATSLMGISRDKLRYKIKKNNIRNS